MNDSRSSRLRRLFLRLTDGLIQEVPPEIAQCELCRKTECSEHQWIVCDNRIAYAKYLEAIGASEQR